MPEEVKSRKPANTAFKQQRLKTWQPLLTPKTVLPAFFVAGLIFIPLGIALYLASESVSEIILDYTNCIQADLSWTPVAHQRDGTSLKEWKYNANTKLCSLRVNIPTTFKKPVFMYYRLTNFYQNHRRYVKSFDANQLRGSEDDSIGIAHLTTHCDPLRNASATTTFSVSPDAVYYPCGLIANSMYSDIVSPLRCHNVTFEDKSTCTPEDIKSHYEFQEKGIAWPSDVEKYKNINITHLIEAKIIPSEQEIGRHFVPPPLWQLLPKYSNGYNSTNFPDLANMERLHVWMRTAGLPNFRKLWGRNMDQDLDAGIWEFDVELNFNATKFSGTKSIVISTVSILGGKNPFLGIAYLLVGIICWVLGFAFLVRHMIKPRKLGDHTYLSWNQPVIDKNNEGNEKSNLMGKKIIKKQNPTVTKKKERKEKPEEF